ncbi:histone-binding protein N1/N2 isoform X2 [Etheostoma spectabile]|uniref:histone-binding protein N1/N2 isoform X2 n=1 Tax=Etheostoma spectabile TaxID=54343 RepID=UPI0013AF1572|nr:histone-binding protein N1/N2-like isoform X2 [Etheostoma spectabile]
MEEANKLIGTGKKYLVMGKVVEAVNALQEACGMLAKKYGDTADECGEAFFWCGKALLDLARMENSVLGNALEGVPEEDEEKPKDSNVDSTENIDEKTRDELRVQVYDAMAEKKNEDLDKVEAKKAGGEGEKAGGEGEKAGGEGEKAGGEGEKAEGCDEQQNSKKDEEKSGVNESKDKVENGKEAQKESGDKEEKTEDGGEEEEKEDCDVEMEGDAEEQEDSAAEKDSDEEEEEVGNLQLAWEMLEVAKVIYKRKEAKEDQLMAAQTHLKLGEVSSESGNYTQALEDFQECLKLQVKHLDSDSRLLAETHYQLGLTYSLDLQYSQAIEELKSSISVIRSRLDKLQELLDKAEGPEALPEERKEMEELKALLPEIQDKVEDATEGLKGALDGGSTSSAFPGSAVHNGPSSSSSKIDSTSTNEVSSTNEHASTAPVSNISHLVRKKRKPEESPVKEGVKKVKQNDGQTNGAHKANGDTNGHADSTEVKNQ